MCDPRQRLEQITTTTTKVSKCDGWTRLHVPRAVRDRSKFAERDVKLSSTRKLQLLAHHSRRNGDHLYTGESAQSIGILIHSAPFLSLRNFHKAINFVSVEADRDCFSVDVDFKFVDADCNALLRF
eukprot:TRINITY_DN1124_c0_g1_i7.p1 TRINITY_DN1124_c0_g1~~TRINITY_DN1124_c0_g1_i7.p1  ORF type:complete len:126 (-),score=11.65 TRINITY_DN1124_c0_g1_i7:201-578(-)